MTGRRCEVCDRAMTPDTESLPSPPRWCSESCGDRAIAGDPRWIRVDDLTAEQRAELGAIIEKAMRLPC